jgi:P pilus assembly chaperone PapD
MIRPILRSTSLRLAALAAAALLADAALARTAAAQGVLVAPTALFVDARVRTASLMLVNPNPDRVELDLSAAYGVTVTDSTGALQLEMPERPDSSAPNAAGWVRMYPRRLTLEPNAQQTVRIMVSPPVGIPDGEYWSRLIITARGAKLPVTQQTDSGAVQVGLSVEVRTIIPLLYRKGRVMTGATVSSVRAERQGDSLAVRSVIERQGNAAALGTVRAELVDSTGRTRATAQMPMSAYYTVDPRLLLPIDSVPAGRYTVRVEIASGRVDLPPEATLPFATARDSAVVTLP